MRGIVFRGEREIEARVLDDPEPGPGEVVIAAHLSPGGVLITAPDDLRESFRGSYVSCSTMRAEGEELTFVEYTHDPDPGDTLIESIFIYFIREGSKVRVEEDRHLHGLFPLAGC